MVFPMGLGVALSGLAGAGASIFGASQASASSRRAAKLALKGTRLSIRAQQRMNQKNLRWQTKFARRAVQWKARDAKKAGLHPLAGIGAQTQAFSPSFQAGDYSGYNTAAQSIQQGGAAAANLYAQAGQNLGAGISDALNAAYTAQTQELHIQNMKLQNAALAADIRVRSQPGYSPYRSSYSRIDGQGDATPTAPGLIEHHKGNLGTITTSTKDVKDRIEDTPQEWQKWFMDQIWDPLMNTAAVMPGEKPKPGYHWAPNVVTGRWNQVPNKKPSSWYIPIGSSSGIGYGDPKEVDAIKRRYQSPWEPKSSWWPW